MTPRGRARALAVLASVLVVSSAMVDGALLAVLLLGAVAIATTLRRSRSFDAPVRAAWTCFAIGGASFLTAQVAAVVQAAVTGVDQAFPSAGDPFFLLGYAAMILGGLRLVRLRTGGSDLDGVLDGLILAASLGVVEWAWVIAPVIGYGLEPGQAGLTVVYGVLDLVLAGVVMRLAVGGGARIASYYFMAGSIAMIVVTDIGYTLYLTGSGTEWPLPMGTTASFALFALAAMHPTMPRLADPAPLEPGPLSALRPIALGGAVALAPVVVLVEWQRRDLLVVVGATVGWVILLGLVVFRLSRMVWARERQERVERTLRNASAAFIASRSSTQMEVAAVHAAVALCEGAWSEATLLHLSDGALVPACAAASSGAPDAPEGDACAGLEHPAALARGGTLTEDRGPGAHRLVAPLLTRGELRGALVVNTPRMIPPHVVRSLETLAAQLAFALESAELAEMRAKEAAEHRFTALVRNARDLVIVLGSGMRLVFASPSIELLLGYRPEEAVGMLLTDLVHPDDREAVTALVAGAQVGVSGRRELLAGARNGRWISLDATVADMTADPAVQGIVMNARDVSERKALELEISQKAVVDSLTGMPNRAQLVSRATHALGRRSSPNHGVAVAWINIDDFQALNASVGYELGNRALVTLGSRIDNATRAEDTAARLGADDFAILFEEVASREEVTTVLRRVVAKLRDPLFLESSELFVTASVGVVFDSERSMSGEVLLRGAELAMREAKLQGGNCIELFDDAMDAAAQRRLEYKRDLFRALERGQFFLDYQPIVSPLTGEIAGFEALARWRHDVRGIVPPTDFIPIIESSGLMVPFGRWAFDQACHQLRTWMLGYPDREISMSVNLSPRQLREPDLVDRCREAMERWKVPASRLVLEITEATLTTEDAVTASNIGSLIELGVKLAIDDFGTGYSSLGLLGRFPVDTIKIDRSFVTPLAKDGDLAIVQTVVELARQVGARTVAEGVETPEQLAVLTEIGVDLVQGFLFAKPLSVTDATALLGAQTPFPQLAQPTTWGLEAINPL